jgi:outer membrane protein TolC
VARTAAGEHESGESIMTHRFPMMAALIAAALHAGAPDGGAQNAPRALTLGDAVRLASTQSAGALIARYHTEEMDARSRSSHAALLPSAGAAWGDGERSFNTASFGIPFPGFDPNGSIIGPVRTIDARAHASATLWNPGALSEYRNAQASESRAGADAAQAVEGAMSVAAMAYVRAERADAQLAARAADSSLAQNLLEIAQGELSAGAGVALDVTRAQAQLSRVRAQLAGARNERDRTRLELLRAVGLPLTTTVVLRDSLGVVAAAGGDATADAAIQDALTSRNDLRVLADAVTATERAVQASRAEWKPTVGFYVDEGATSASYSYLRHTYTYSFGVSIPLFEAGRREARVDERDAILRAAEVRRRDLETQIAFEVRGALLDLASAREQTGAAREGLSFAEQAVAQARDRFSTGVAGSGDVVSAQLDVTAARALYIDALTSLQSARIALARAQGHLAALP